MLVNWVVESYHLHGNYSSLLSLVEWTAVNHINQFANSNNFDPVQSSEPVMMDRLLPELDSIDTTRWILGLHELFVAACTIWVSLDEIIQPASIKNFDPVHWTWIYYDRSLLHWAWIRSIILDERLSIGYSSPLSLVERTALNEINQLAVSKVSNPIHWSGIWFDGSIAGQFGPHRYNFDKSYHLHWIHASPLSLVEWTAVN